MAADQKEVQRDILQEARERLERMRSEQGAQLDAATSPEPATVPTPQAQAPVASQTPQEPPAQVPALSDGSASADTGSALQATKDRLSAAQLAAGLKPENNKGVWSDMATTAKIAALYPVAGKLQRGEVEMGLRELTKNKVVQQIPEDDLVAIESLAKSKYDRPVAELKWSEMSALADQHYRTSDRNWQDRLSEMAGYMPEDERWVGEGSSKPYFPMAKELIEGSIQSGTLNFYEHFIRPVFSDDTPELAENMVKAIQEATEGYSAATKASLEKTMVAEDAVWYNPLTYFDENTKDPFHDFSAFLHTAGQQSGNLVGMAVAARTGGRIGARQYTRSLAGPGSSVAQIQALQKTGAMAGGAAAGGKAEMALIRDAVFGEAQQRISEDVPDEVWVNHEPYQLMVDGGLTPTEAKQIIAYGHAQQAGDMAMVISGALMGTPMGAFYGSLTGRSAGRTLAKESIIRQMGKGAALETGQEMAQEFSEQVASNLAVMKVNPDQDMYEGGLEAVITAAFISAPFGAVGGIRSDRGAGITEQRDKMIRASQPWVNAANEKHKFQNKVGAESKFAKDASPQDQLKAMYELERLQKKEAEAFLKIEPEARKLMDAAGADNDQRMQFEARVAGYQTDLAYIAKRQNARTTAKKAQREEQQAQRERAEAKAAVERDVTTINQNLELVEQLQTVQRGGALNSEAEYEELAKAGYGNFIGKGDSNFVLTKRGVRAMQEAAEQASDLRDKVDAGFTGQDRRTQSKLREAYENLSDDEFEGQILKDQQTNLWNRRKLDMDMAENPPAAVAFLDADALKWVNDNMSHSAGDEYLRSITRELENLGKGIQAYRRGGDEFVVTGPDMEAVQEAVEKAKGRIANTSRVEEQGKSVAVNVSVGFGTTLDEADDAANADKARRIETGERVDTRVEGAVPPSLQTVEDKSSPQMALFALSRDHEKMNDDMFDATNPRQEELWDEYIRHAEMDYNKNLFDLKPAEQEQFDWVQEVVNDFLPAGNANNPPVTLANDATWLKQLSLNQYNELMDMPFGAAGVRGLFSMDDPTHGVFLFIETIVREARSGLKYGNRTVTWQSAKYRVSSGDTVEVIDEDGKIRQGVVEKATAKKSLWEMGSRYSSYGSGNFVSGNFVKGQTPVERRLADNAVTARQKMAKLEKRQLALMKAHSKMSAEKRADKKHPTYKQLVEVIDELGSLESDVQVMQGALVDERSRRWQKMKAEAKLAKPKETKELDPGKDEVVVRVGGKSISFDPVKNEATNNDEAYAKGLYLGQFREKKGAKWHSNLGNMEAALDEPLTKERVQRVAADTLMHETVGHFGIRGITKDWDSYLKLSHALVDAFPEVVEQLRMMGYNYRDDIVRGEQLNAQNKALLGEEVMAWIAGRETGKLDMAGMNLKQQNAVRRFLSWLKQQLIDMGFNKYYRQFQAARIRSARRALRNAKTGEASDAAFEKLYGTKDTPGLVHLGKSGMRQGATGKYFSWKEKVGKPGVVVRAQKGFLNDDDLLNIVQRSMDFIRNGKTKWKFDDHEGSRHLLPMRDVQIFRKPVHHVMASGTRSRAADEQFTDEELLDQVRGEVDVKIPSVAEAYQAVTGETMPEGWRPLTPGDFKDEAKRLQKEGVKTNPKQLFDEATANMSEEERGLAGKVQSTISQAKAEKTRREKGIKSKRAKIDLLNTRWGKDVVENDQIPIFPEVSTVAGFMTAINEAMPAAGREGILSHDEVEASGVLDKIWPSRLEKWVDDAWIDTEVLISKTSFTMERIKQLMEPGTQLTKAEAKELHQHIKARNESYGEPNGAPYVVPENQMSEKALMQNNALSVKQFKSFMSQYQLTGQDLNLATIMAVLGEDHPSVVDYKNMMKEEADASRPSNMAVVRMKMHELLDAPIDVTKTVIPKDWVMQQIEVPQFEVSVGQAGQRTYHWKSHYEWITGSTADEMLLLSEVDADLQRQIRESQKRDYADGPEIGYNPVSDKWYLPSYTGASSDYSSLMPNFIVPGSFESVVFWQKPFGSARTAHISDAPYRDTGHSGPRGIFGHARYSAFYDADPNAPIAPNPAMQGQSFNPFEFQSDYYQRLAKLYKSAEDSDNASKVRSQDGLTLSSITHNLFANMQSQFTNMISEEFNSFRAQVTDEDVITYVAGSEERWDAMTNVDKELAREVMTLRRIRDSGHGVVNNIVETLAEARSKAQKDYKKMLFARSGNQQNLTYDDFERGVGSGAEARIVTFVGDARMYEWNDIRAFDHILENLIPIAQEYERYTGRYADAVPGASNNRFDHFKEHGGYRKVLRESGNKHTVTTDGAGLTSRLKNAVDRTGLPLEIDQVGHRIPFMRSELQTRLTSLLETLGAKTPRNTSYENVVSELLDDAMDVSVATIVIEAQAYSDLLAKSRGEIDGAIMDWSNTESAVPFRKMMDVEGDNVVISVAGSTKELTAWAETIPETLKETLAIKLTESSLGSVAHSLRETQEKLEREWHRVRGQEMTIFGEDFKLVQSSVRITDDETDPFQHSNMGMAGTATAAEAEQTMRDEGLETFDRFSARKWAIVWGNLPQAEKDAVQQAGGSEETPTNDWYAKFADQWNDSKPLLIKGELPVKWNQQSVPTETVGLRIIKKTVDDGDRYKVYIDGDLQGRWEWWEIQNEFSQIIHVYYRDNSIEMVPWKLKALRPTIKQWKKDLKALMDQQKERTEEGRKEANDLFSHAEMQPQVQIGKETEPAKAFTRLMEHQKARESYSNMHNQPNDYGDMYLSGKNDQWQVTQIMWSISEAIRRGYSRIQMIGGEAGGVRGGFLSSASDAYDKYHFANNVKYKLTKQTVRGQERDIMILTADTAREPMWVDVTDDKIAALNPDVKLSENPDSINEGYYSAQLARQLGRDVAEVVANKLRLSHTAPTAGRLMIVQAGETYILQDSSGNIIDTYASKRTAQNARTRMQGESVNSMPSIEGSVSKGDVSGPLMFLKTHYSGSTAYQFTNREYRHSFAKPTLEGLRYNYDGKLFTKWNAYLKRFGLKLEEGYIKVPTGSKMIDAVYAMGARKKVNVEAKFAEDFQNIRIEEVTGENYGWIINSDGGLLSQSVYQSQADADVALAGILEKKTVTEDGTMKAYTVTFNDKIIEEHSKPVNAHLSLNYQLRSSPALEAALDKIGSKEPSLLSRFKAWRKTWLAEWNTGMFDRFYGIMSALKSTEQSDLPAEDNPYIQARLTTGLDAMMRGVFEFGHPIWKDGIVQSEGKGLLKVLEPVADNVEHWAGFMAGVRSKRLMMEGFEKLTVPQQAAISKAAQNFKGATNNEKIFNLLVYAYRTKSAELPKINRREFLKGIGLGAVAASAGLPTSSDADTLANEIVGKDLKGRIAKDSGKILPPKTKFKNPEQARYNWRKKIMEEAGATKEQADQSIDRAVNQAIENQRVETAARRVREASKIKKGADADADVGAAMNAIEELVEGGRERLFDPEQIEALVDLGEQFPMFKQVAKDYAHFNKKILDFAEEAGVINAETRPLWENADYIPFYRIAEERMTGPLGKGMGVANQRSPIKTLKGGSDNLGDLVHNIFMNVTKLVDSSVKNNAARASVKALEPTGMMKKVGMDMAKALIPMEQVKKILDQNGIDIDGLPEDVLGGLRTMFAVTPPKGNGILSVMEDGKQQYYYVEDPLLYRSLTALNMEAFGKWMQVLRAPKRLLTTMVTLDPGFMVANFIRDSMSGWVMSRDNYIPIAGALKGFGKALVEGETMQAMISSGAAFDNGNINQSDPKATHRYIKKAMRDVGFQRTLLNTPRKLFNAWKRLGSATENANRIAVYDAALRAGKSKAQAAYESKDLMDFSMGGDWPFIQFLIQSVPFMGARMQGLQRLGRGATEHPVGFFLKGSLITAASIGLWAAFREDDRYKGLEDWDKDAYYHWWIGETHYRLPKGFEVGAIFSTIPERIFEHIYSQENDAGKFLIRRFGYMIAETFNMNPVPQAIRPMTEMLANYSFFGRRHIESPWEQEKLPEDRYKYYTSPTMIELAASLPDGLNTVLNGKIKSPLQLQNLFAGYFGTLGRYGVMAADAGMRYMLDYPTPPEMTIAQYPVLGRFFRGDEPRRTRYEEEVYRELRTVMQVMNSHRMADDDKSFNDDRLNELEDEYMPYIDRAKDFNRIRQEISDLNSEIREEYLDEKLTPAEKRARISNIQKEKNAVFKEAYEDRPGAVNDEETDDDLTNIETLIDGFDPSTPEDAELRAVAPATAELVAGITTMPTGQLDKLIKAGNYSPRGA